MNGELNRQQLNAPHEAATIFLRVDLSGLAEQEQQPRRAAPAGCAFRLWERAASSSAASHTSSGS
jgi:hypothetical protein